MPDGESVALVGGTGPLGRGLACRLAVAGVRVWLGSRDKARAQDAVKGLMPGLPRGSAPLAGVSNQAAIDRGEIVILTVPYGALRDQAAALSGLDASRVVVSTAAPMEFHAGLANAISPAAGSAAEMVAELWPDALVVAALHTVAAPQLLRLDQPLDEDVLVTGDDLQAKDIVIAMIGRIDGLRPIDAGPLKTAGMCEGITPLLLRLNRLHRAHTGIRITGL